MRKYFFILIVNSIAVPSFAQDEETRPHNPLAVTLVESYKLSPSDLLAIIQDTSHRVTLRNNVLIQEYSQIAIRHHGVWFSLQLGYDMGNVTYEFVDIDNDR